MRSPPARVGSLAWRCTRPLARTGWYTSSTPRMGEPARLRGWCGTARSGTCSVSQPCSSTTCGRRTSTTAHASGSGRMAPYTLRSETWQRRRSRRIFASLNGKVLRFSDDGTTPADNPFRSPVWSWGHRNPQGLDWHPATGDLFETEHGATGNDEINVIDRGPELWVADHRSRCVSSRHADADCVLRAGSGAIRRLLLPGHRVRFLPQRPVRRNAEGAGAAPSPPQSANPRRVQSTERLLENRFGRLRDVVSGPDGFLLHRDEQPRRAWRAGVRRRSDPETCAVGSLNCGPRGLVVLHTVAPPRRRDGVSEVIAPAANGERSTVNGLAGY